MMNLLRHRIYTIVFTLAACPAALGVTIGQVDDFQDGTEQGWGANAQSFTIETDGGPTGAGDQYFSYSANGIGGANSRMIVPNEFFGNQWSGDYLVAGVTAISFDLNNLGTTALDMRLAVGDAFGNYYITATPVALPAASGWTTVEFNLTDSEMTLVNGGGTLDSVLDDVQSLRLLSSTDLPTLSFSGRPRGDVIESVLGIDNVTAIGVPEPATIALLAAGLCGLVTRRSRV